MSCGIQVSWIFLVAKNDKKNSKTSNWSSRKQGNWFEDQDSHLNIQISIRIGYNKKNHWMNGRRRRSKKLNFCFRALRFIKNQWNSLGHLWDGENKSDFTSHNELTTANNQLLCRLFRQTMAKNFFFSRHFKQVSSKFLDDVSDKFF